MKINRSFVVAFLSVVFLVTRGPLAEGKRPLPANVQRVLSCVLPIEGEERRFLHLARTSGVYIHYSETGIPRTSQSQLANPPINVIIYSPDQTRAVIRTAYIEGNNVEVSQMPYSLVKKGGDWQVTDGEGGAGTFDAVAYFVSSLSSIPRTFVQVRGPEPSGCENAPL
jgi:hypothetical protein